MKCIIGKSYMLLVSPPTQGSFPHNRNPYPAPTSMFRPSLFEAVRSKPERTTQLLSKEDRNVEDARHIRYVLGSVVAAASVLSTVRNGALVHLPQVPAVLDQSFPDAIVSSIDAIETQGYAFRASLSDRLKFPDTSGAVVLGLVASTQHQPTWRRLPGLLSDRSIAAIARGDSEEAVSAVVPTPIPFLTHGPEFSSAVACVAQSLAGGVAALADLTVLTLGVSGVGTGVGLSPFASDVRSPEQLWKVGAAWGQCLVRLFGLAWSASAADMLIQQLAVECMTGPAAALVCLPMLEAVASACVLKSGGHRIFAAESVQWDRNQEGVRARLLGVHRGIGQDETVRALRVLGASWSLVKVLLGKTEDNPVQVMAGEDLTNSRLWLLVRAAGCVSACVQGPVLKIGQVSLARLIRFLGLAAVVAMEMWPIVAGPPGHEAQPWSIAVLGSEQVEVAGNHQLAMSNLWSAVVAVVKECAERANRASVYTPILSEVVDAVVAVATVAASLRAGYDEHLTFLSEQIVAVRVRARV